jgi:hypothetical protein
LLCEWGPASEFQDEDPRFIVDSQRNFTEFFEKEVVQAEIHRLTVKSALVSNEVSKVMSAVDNEIYKTRPQETDLPTRASVLYEERGVPKDFHEIPPDQLGTVYILAYDDRDPIQRRWLLDWLETAPTGSQWVVIAAAWSSHESLDAFRRSAPGANIMSMGDKFVKTLDITTLPCVMAFPEGKKQTVSSGYDLPALEERERKRARAEKSSEKAWLSQATDGIRPIGEKAEKMVADPEHGVESLPSSTRTP